MRDGPRGSARRRPDQAQATPVSRHLRVRSRRWSWRTARHVGAGTRPFPACSS
jgi:hypothetical protein